MALLDWQAVNALAVFSRATGRIVHRRMVEMWM